MGLSIHYKGGIDRVEDIPKFVDELEDIADSMDWMSQRINDDEIDPAFRGIIVNPKGDCEPLCFIFDREGRLRPLMDLITDQIEPTEYSYYTATKTQFATIETHVWIIGLLRYLKKHTLSDLEVTDEGEYWETENLETLKKKKQFLQSMIDQLSGALNQAAPLPEDSSTEDIIAHIESIVEKLHDKHTPEDS
ncbi:MAG: hypothetical protein ACSHX8_07280 [Opitutaceae bacterium]